MQSSGGAVHDGRVFERKRANSLLRRDVLSPRRLGQTHARTHKAKLSATCSALSITRALRLRRAPAFVLAAGMFLAFAPGDQAWATCTTSGNVTTCTTNPPNPWTTRIGSGPNTPNGAQISVGNSNAISLGDGAEITLGDNSSVTNNASSSAGQWNAGPNTIEFGSNGRLIVGGDGVWGRIEISRARTNAAFSTSGLDSDLDRWLVQVGADAAIARGADGGVLMGGYAVHYAESSADIRAMFGDGAIETQGFGLSAALTWYGDEGFYIDGQGRLNWYDSDLSSDTLGALASGVKGHGLALGLEIGDRISLTERLSLTPQAQTVYSRVGFDRFSDPASALVANADSDSLKTRLGVSLDHQQRGNDGRSRHLYGLVNLTYEWLDRVEVDVSGVRFGNRNERLCGELGLGGSWVRNRFTLYAEAAANTALEDFGDSYSVNGVVGLRVGF